MESFVACSECLKPGIFGSCFANTTLPHGASVTLYSRSKTTSKGVLSLCATNLFRRNAACPAAHGCYVHSEVIFTFACNSAFVASRRVSACTLYLWLGNGKDMTRTTKQHNSLLCLPGFLELPNLQLHLGLLDLLLKLLQAHGKPRQGGESACEKNTLGLDENCLRRFHSTALCLGRAGRRPYCLSFAAYTTQHMENTTFSMLTVWTGVPFKTYGSHDLFY